jgi:ADP-ribosyltransferase-like protein
MWRDTAVTDDEGKPLVVYHGTQGRFIGFDPKRMKTEGVHFGTRHQAEMRAGPRGEVVAALLHIPRLRRARDTGGQWRKVIAAAKKAGYDGIVYLNRYEGIDRSTVLRAIDQKVDLDKLTDAELAEYATELNDSYIAFYPEQITVVSA